MAYEDPAKRKAYYRAWYLKNRKSAIEKSLKHYHKHRKKRCAQNREWRRRNRVRRRLYKREHVSKNIEHYREYWRIKSALRRGNPDNRPILRARDAVQTALQSGKLQRPLNCQKCGEKCKPQAHHYLGYSKDHYLDVEWLCQACHHLAHHPTNSHVSP